MCSRRFIHILKIFRCGVFIQNLETFCIQGNVCKSIRSFNIFSRNCLFFYLSSSCILSCARLLFISKMHSAPSWRRYGDDLTKKKKTLAKPLHNPLTKNAKKTRNVNDNDLDARPLFRSSVRQMVFANVK